MSDTERPKRRLPHFSILLLATIILVGAVIALSLWLPYHREQKILAELTRLNFARMTVASRPDGWRWLADLLGPRGDHLFQRVVSFDADDAGTDDRCLQLIGQLHSLEALSLDYVDFTEDDITGAPPDEYRITNSGFKQLENLTRLESLSLAYAGISSDALETIGRFTKLRSLSLAGCPIEGTLEDLSALSRLEILHLHDSRISNAGLQQVPALPALWALTLDRTHISSAGLDHLDRLSGLRELSLTRTAVDDQALKQIAKLPNLQILRLNETRVTGAAFDALKSLVQLQALDLTNCRVGDSGLDHIAALPNLQYLTLEGTSVTDAGISKLASSPNLKSLNLERTQVTDEGVTSLARIATLTRLQLTDSRVTGVGLARLGNALPTCEVNYRLPP